MSITIELIDKNGNSKAIATGKTDSILDGLSYSDGDKIRFETTLKNIVVDIAKDVCPAIVYVPDGVFEFPIPVGEATKGFSPETFTGENSVKAREATEEELFQYRNVCLNPLDVRLESEVVDPNAPEWSNPVRSKAVEEDDQVKFFPHAYANRVTRNEGDFFARNAIDGKAVPGGHGPWPYQSWGGAVHEDLTLTVYFGKEVEVDKLVLCLRSDYELTEEGKEHDTYWHTALIELSDGFSMEINPKKLAEPQEFDLGSHVTTWISLSRLDPLQHDGSANFAALNQIEVWGKDK